MNYSHLNQFGSLMAAFTALAETQNGSTSCFTQNGEARFVTAEVIRATHQEFLDCLLRAQRFIAPEIGGQFIGEVTYEQRHIDLLHLPFDDVALLYKQQIHADGSELAICSIYSKTHATARDAIKKGTCSDSAFVCLTAINWETPPRGWAIDPVGILIDPCEFIEGRGFPISMFCTVRGGYDISSMGAETTKTESQKLAAIVDLCCALACSNVHSRAVEPDSQKNRKRVAAGKKPLLSYKVLEVDIDDGEGGGNTLGSDRQSPRTHLRRGHIRRVQSGKLVWVQACVVRGKTPGIVLKDYSIPVS